MKKKGKQCCPRSGWQKLFLIMRLSLILLLVSMMQVTASVYSQNTKLSVEVKNQSIVDVLKSIEDQSDFHFFYKNEQIDVNRKVSVAIENKSVEQVLESIFEGTGIEYRFFGDKLILLSANDATTNGAVNAMQQKGKISGIVVDEEGLPLPGVTVLVKGTTIGVTTNTDGEYSIEVPATAAVLQFSFVGMHTTEVELTGQSKVDIVLKTDAIGLEEVVAIGYGVKKKATLTGAVSTLNPDELEGISTPSFSTLLAGELAGLNVLQTTGNPGSPASFKIRVQNTFSDKGQPDPLFVIDGMIRRREDFEMLTVNEIEEFSILKDAASTAIYGRQGGAGVVLITTKKGKLGKPTITYSGTFTTERPTEIPEALSIIENAELTNAYFMRRDGNLDDPNTFTPDELEFFKDYPYDSWSDAIIRNPMTQQHVLSISGGSDKIRFFVSGKYLDNKGLFEKSTHDNYSLRSNLQFDVTDDLTVDVGFSTYRANDNQWLWGGWEDRNALDGLWGLVAYQPQWWPPHINGKPTLSPWAQPYAVLKGGSYNDQKWANMNADLAFTYKVPQVEGLSVSGKYIKYQYTSENRSFNQHYEVYDFKRTGGHNHIFTDELVSPDPKIYAPIGSEYISNAQSRYDTYRLNASINYGRDFGKHTIGGLFLYEQSETDYNYLSAYRQNFPVLKKDEFFAASNDDADKTGFGRRGDAADVGYVGRLSYDYDDKYLFEVAGRYDGSTKFSPDERWGFFPATSVGWVVSRENFFENLNSPISFAKLRASYGVVGSDATNSWEWQSVYEVSNGYVFGSTPAPKQGVYNKGLANYNLTWEETAELNLGLDLYLFEGKLQVAAEHYRRNTTGIFAPRIQQTPATFGATLPNENYGETKGSGYELSAVWKETKGDFTYSIGVNGATGKTEIVTIDQADNVWERDNRIGRPISYTKGFRSLGIIRNQAELDAFNAKYPDYNFFGKKAEVGLLVYEDVNGPDQVDENGNFISGEGKPDGIVNYTDHVVLIEDNTPRFRGGLNLGVSWKGLSVLGQFYGVAGWKRMNTSNTRHFRVGYGNSTLWRDYWREDNQDAAMPAPNNQDQWHYEGSSFWIKDASFLRLKLLTLAYSLPQNWIEPLNIQNVQLSLSGTNLFTIHNYWHDPELGNELSYPLMRSFTFGVAIKL